MKLAGMKKKIEVWAILLSVVTFLVTQWEQNLQLEAQTVANNKAQLQELISRIRDARDLQNEKELKESFSVDIKTEHYSTYLDARLVMQELPEEQITPSQYLAIAFESWEIGARGLESIELAKKAVKMSEAGSIEQLNSLSQLGDYYFMMAELYEAEREKFVPRGHNAYQRMEKAWPHDTEWRKGMLDEKLKNYSEWKVLLGLPVSATYYICCPARPQ